MVSCISFIMEKMLIKDNYRWHSFFYCPSTLPRNLLQHINRDKLDNSGTGLQSTSRMRHVWVSYRKQKSYSAPHCLPIILLLHLPTFWINKSNTVSSRLKDLALISLSQQMHFGIILSALYLWYLFLSSQIQFILSLVWSSTLFFLYSIVPTPCFSVWQLSGSIPIKTYPPKLFSFST
jgi:hypothetical protein